MPIAPFDASRAFTVWALKLLASGKWYVRGDSFDKDSVAPQVLRSLYNSSQLVYDGENGMAPRDPLLTKRERRANAKGAARKPTVDEDTLAEQLVEANTKPKLLEMADGLEGVRGDMNKKAIALAIIRAGRGLS